MPFILAVDYDNTLFHGSYPVKGPPKPKVIKKVKEFKKYGAKVILWTCRSRGRVLIEAIHRCREAGLRFDAINDNVPSQKRYMESQRKKGNIFALRKVFADFYLDDSANNVNIFLRMNAKEICRNFANKKRI